MSEPIRYEYALGPEEDWGDGAPVVQEVLAVRAFVPDSSAPGASVRYRSRAGHDCWRSGRPLVVCDACRIDWEEFMLKAASGEGRAE